MKVTKRQAEKVLASVRQQFADYCDGDYGPELIENFDGDTPAISWEGGPFEWTMHFPHEFTNWEHVETLVSEFSMSREDAIKKSTRKGVTLPKGVWCQAYDGCTIGIYRV